MILLRGRVIFEMHLKECKDWQDGKLGVWRSKGCIPGGRNW